MKDDFENGGLWDLLGHSKAVSVSPYFSRRVLRDIHQKAECRTRPLLPVFLLRWVGAGAFAVVAAAFFLSLGLDSSTSARMTSNSSEFIEAFDAAAGIDTLLVVDDSAISAYANGL